MWILFRNYNDHDGNMIIDELLSNTIYSNREDAIVALRAKFQEQIKNVQDYVERENVTLKQYESIVEHHTLFDFIIIDSGLLDMSIASRHFYIKKMQLV